jgi:hypothetical protein
MKLLTFISLLIVILLCGCRKDTVYQNDPASAGNVEGTWHYIGYIQSTKSGSLNDFIAAPHDLEGPYLQLHHSSLLLSYSSQGPIKCIQYEFEKDMSAAISAQIGLKGWLRFSDTSNLLPVGSGKQFDLTLRQDTLILYPSHCAGCLATVYMPSLKLFICEGQGIQ